MYAVNGGLNYLLLTTQSLHKATGKNIWRPLSSEDKTPAELNLPLGLGVPPQTFKAPDMQITRENEVSHIVYRPEDIQKHLKKGPSNDLIS